MSDTNRIFRVRVAIEPLTDLPMLDEDVAQDELLALGGVRIMLVNAAEAAKAEVRAEEALRELHPLIAKEAFDIECDCLPLSAHEEMSLRKAHPDLTKAGAWHVEPDTP